MPLLFDTDESLFYPKIPIPPRWLRPHRPPLLLRPVAPAVPSAESERQRRLSLLAPEKPSHETISQVTREYTRSGYRAPTPGFAPLPLLRAFLPEQLGGTQPGYSTSELAEQPWWQQVLNAIPPSAVVTTGPSQTLAVLQQARAQASQTVPKAAGVVGKTVVKPLVDIALDEAVSTSELIPRVRGAAEKVLPVDWRPQSLGSLEKGDIV